MRYALLLAGLPLTSASSVWACMFVCDPNGWTGLNHGLCYSAPPVSSGVGGERGGSASFFYWGVNGEHYAPHNASFGVATVPKGRYVGLRARDAQQTAIVQTVALVCWRPL